MKLYTIQYRRKGWRELSSTTLEANSQEDAKRRMRKLDKGAKHPIVSGSMVARERHLG